MNTPQDFDTIEDFGRQWTKFRSNPGFYASSQVLQNLLEPLLPVENLEGKKIIDVGAGTGRYVRLLHAFHPEKILAVEPSDAFTVLKENVSDLDNVECRRIPAEDIPPMDFDLVFCVGVLQFIPDQISALKAMGRALNPDGQAFFWVYGRENNELYINIIRPVRQITSRLSHNFLDRLSDIMLIPVSVYSFFCRFLPLPLSTYIRKYFARMDTYSKKLIIYDQLNPVMARYYRKDELIQILESAGFADIRIKHHLGYSWSVLARYRGDRP